MKIRCIYNRGYGGEVIEMEIDNKSKINYISYKYNDDTVGEANEVYEITSSKIIFNKNPLIQNQNNFKGAIELKGVVELKSVNMFEFSKKEKFHFKGYMICE